MKYERKNNFQAWIKNNGKKEFHRFGFYLSLIIILATYFLYVPYLKDRLSTRVSDTHLNPAVALLEKRNLIVNFQKLRDSLTQKYEIRNDYMVSIYFEYLPTGANISINKDVRMWPASLIKIPVAMAIMKKIEKGEWKLDNELAILDQDKDTEYGDLYKEETGTTLPIQKFLEESLIESDNTAHFVLLRNLEGEELEDVYVHLGMDDIIETLKKSPDEKEVDNRITAKRYSIFFRSLYNSTYLTPEYSELFLSILKRAPKELLSKGIPEDVDFVHKTGVRVDEAVRADSGIVYVPGRPYLLTVMIQKKGADKTLNEQEVSGIFEDISREIYSYVKNAR